MPSSHASSASMSRSRTSADIESLADSMLRSSLSGNTWSSASSSSSAIPPPPYQSTGRAYSPASIPRTMTPTPKYESTLRSTSIASTESTSSRTRERLREVEKERDELRLAMSGERAKASKLQKQCEEERAIAARVKREGVAPGLSASDVKHRVSELRRDAKVAGREVGRQSTDGMFRRACSTDLLFLMDTTGSMQSYITAAKDQVKKIMHDISNKFLNEAEIRIAVVGYKDHEDTPNIEFLDFTTSTDEVRSFLDGLTASGGGDAPEDVLGGIRQAINATWKHQTRCVIHIGDAPPHGRIFHSFGRDSYIEPGSEPHRLTYQPLLRQMVDLGINYALLHITRHTDLMAYLFLQEYTGASPDCKLLATNKYYSEAVSKASTIRSGLRGGGSSTASAHGGLLFEELQLGTEYSALRHLVVKSVTSSASRTAVRMSMMKSRSSSGKLSKKSPMASYMTVIKEDEGDAAEIELETGSPQWQVPGWLDETLTMEGFCPDVVVHGANTLNDMMAHDDNIKLSVVELTIRKRSKPFAQGAMRMASYACASYSTNKFVVKSFKREGKRLAHLAEDMRCQVLCQAFAREFNALAGSDRPIDFLVTTCLKDKSTASGTDFLSMEPRIKGNYVKYNSNNGYVHNDNEESDQKVSRVANRLAQAFSHFTFERSRGQLLVCDVQGVGSRLTDPAIHTLDPERFKLMDTNLGKDGFKFFFATHKCNRICRQLELKSTGAMLVSNNLEFREAWPSMDETVCCSSKLCGKMVRKESSKKSDEFPGYQWCDECWPQLAQFKTKWICLQPGPHHEFEVSRFFYESQGQVAPRKCLEHRQKDASSRVANVGGGFWAKLKSATKKRPGSVVG